MKAKNYYSILILTVSLFLISEANAQAPDWLWAKAIGGANVSDEVTSITTDKFGNIYTVGTFQGTVDFDPGPGTFNLTSTGDPDMFILKLDSSGNFGWAKMIFISQRFYRTYVAIDSLFNIYVSGSFTGILDADPGPNIIYFSSNYAISAFVLKLNLFGNLVWAKHLGVNVGSGIDYKDFYMTMDNRCNIYLKGIFGGTIDFNPDSLVDFNLSSGPQNDIFISKYDNFGNFIWVKTIEPTSSAYSDEIKLDKSGNIYLTGGFYSSIDLDPSNTGVFILNSSGSRDIFILKLDSSGQFKWAKGFGGLGVDMGQSIVLDKSFNLYLSGWFLSDTADFNPDTSVANNLYTINNNSDNFIAKYDSSGSFVWAKEIGGFFWVDKKSYLSIDRQSNIYIAGSINSSSDLDPGPGVYNISCQGDVDHCLIKLDSFGNFIWADNIGGNRTEFFSCPVVIDSVWGIFLAGNFRSDTISNDLIKIWKNDHDIFTSDFFIARLNTQTLTSNNELSETITEAIIYPNPVYQNFTINLNSNYDEVEISITDITGKLFYTACEKGVHKTEINTDNFSDGIYFVQIKSDDFIETKKIVVSK